MKQYLDIMFYENEMCKILEYVGIQKKVQLFFGQPITPLWAWSKDII